MASRQDTEARVTVRFRIMERGRARPWTYLFNSSGGHRAGMSPEHPEVAGDREQREASGFVCRPRRSVAGIAAGLDDHDVHATPLHVLGGVLREPGADPTSLVIGVDADDLDHAHAFVERV